MPRTKSRTNAVATARKGRSTRTGSKTSSSRSGDKKVRRYLDFIRAILGNTPRNGR